MPELPSLPRDYQQLVRVIVTHRLLGIISLEQTNRMFILLFRDIDHHRPAPRFRDLLGRVARLEERECLEPSK